jgi:hypothetical protein
VDRNDKVFTLLYKIVMHQKVSHPDKIQNTFETHEGTKVFCLRVVEIQNINIPSYLYNTFERRYLYTFVIFNFVHILFM